MVREFTANVMMSLMGPGATKLLQLISELNFNRKNYREVSTGSFIMPVPIVPKSFHNVQFLAIDSLEIARQLTIIETKLFTCIKSIEFLGKKWSDFETSTIRKTVRHANNVTAWVSKTILKENDSKRRSNIIVKFIEIADKCRCLNNFATTMAILASMSSSSIYRLRKTWSLINPKKLDIFNELNTLMSPSMNFAKYRKALADRSLPAIPFIGCYLTDLTFLEDGLPSYIAAQPYLVNFAKMGRIADVIIEIQRFQQRPMVYDSVPEIQSMIIEDFKSLLHEEQMYQMSLLLEPKDK
jgi:hypothetical protein